MGARRGSLTFTRCFVQGELPKDLRQRYLKAIRLRVFQPLQPDAEANEASGWCALERPFDLELDAGKIFNDRLLMLGLRTDKYKIPSNLLNAQLAEEEGRQLAKSGKNKLSRHERAEIKQRLVAKLRKKLVPVTRVTDMLWDLDANVVLFFSHAKRGLLDFSALFEKTFGLTLIEDNPYTAAERAELPKALVRRLANVEPLRFSSGRKALAEAAAGTSVPEPKAQEASESEEEVDEVVARIEGTRFLGMEFLLWLWLRAEFFGSETNLGESGECNVWLERQLTFESPIDRNERVTVRGASPTDSSEAREAVRAQKFPVRARVQLESPEREYAFDLVAPRFALATAKLPGVLAHDSEEALLERVSLAQHLLSTLDQLYALFLHDRLGELWQKGWEPACIAWLENESVPPQLLQRLTASAGRPRGSKSGGARSRTARS